MGTEDEAARKGSQVWILAPKLHAKEVQICIYTTTYMSNLEFESCKYDADKACMYQYAHLGSELAACDLHSAMPKICHWHLQQGSVLCSRRVESRERICCATCCIFQAPAAGCADPSRTVTGHPFLAKCTAVEDPISPAPTTNTLG